MFVKKIDGSHEKRKISFLNSPKLIALGFEISWTRRKVFVLVHQKKYIFRYMGYMNNSMLCIFRRTFSLPYFSLCKRWKSHPRVLDFLPQSRCHSTYRKHLEHEAQDCWRWSKARWEVSACFACGEEGGEGARPAQMTPGRSPGRVRRHEPPLLPVAAIWAALYLWMCCKVLTESINPLLRVS